MQWLMENARVVSAVTSVGMLVVWVGYLQLFYLNLRRERRVRVLVQQTAGTAPDASCEVVNMSGSPIDVACVLLAVRTRDAEVVHHLEWVETRAQRRRIDREGEPGPGPRRRRGPIAGGASATIGSFHELLCDGREALSEDGIPENEPIREIEVRVVFFYRTFDPPLAARRRFFIHREDGQTQVSPETSRTHQLISWRNRREAERWYLSVFD